jgi:hypothetical protein
MGETSVLQVYNSYNNINENADWPREDKRQVAIALDGEILQVMNVHAVIESNANQHIKLTLNGMLSSPEYKAYINRIGCETRLQLSYLINDRLALVYQGVITRFYATAEGASNDNSIYHITVEALSCTCLLDIVRKSRTFQDKEMLYSEMISKILKDYNGSCFMETINNGERLSSFLLQYQETDWAFLKRVASVFEQGLYANSQTPVPRLYFGRPSGLFRGDLSCYEYSAVSLNISSHYSSAKNNINSKL